MTPEELDKVKWNEAKARARAANPGGSIIALRKDAAGIYRQLTIDNWTPPAPISPRVLAAREWLKTQYTPGSHTFTDIEVGRADNWCEITAFLAGFAAAVKLAEPLVKEVSRLNPKTAILQPIHDALTTYRQSIGEGE